MPSVQNFTTSLQKRRRLLHTILLAIILATLPCYCAGAMLLGLAPDQNRVRITSTSAPTLIEQTLQTLVGGTPTATLFPTITPLPFGLYTNTPIFGGPVSTPGQYIPPTNTQIVLPTAVPTYTFTLPPTATFFIPTSTQAPTLTPTFTWTPTATPTTPAASTLTFTPMATFTQTPTITTAPTEEVPPANTEPPLPTPTAEVLE